MTSAGLNIGIAVSPTWLRGEAWRAADSRVEELFDLAPFTDLAAAAEAAHLDFLFAPDAGHLDPRVLDRSPGFSTHDSHTLVTALAARTSRIGVVPTVQTLFASPYTAARQLMSLHRLSGGRAGWNAVTALGGGANHGLGTPPGSEERYARARAFVDTVRELWRRYPAEALLLDRAEGRFAEARRVRTVDRDDGHFSVAGPLTVAAHPSGDPPLFQAGGSAAGIAFAGATADAVFAVAATEADAVAQRAALSAAAERAGRPADAVRFLPGLVVTLAESRAEAERAADAQRASRGPAHWAVTGTPGDAVAAIAARAETGAIDGFIALAGGSWRSVELFLGEVVPALAAEGLFRDAYAGRGLREHLGLR
ncbi:LLM class flavin-dependent oxidoreductase [Leucobacter sp. CSA1]|uniref:LLM class flavin-dependent oxidoreductase n=1 Tax=Leucobacter chromiisoli TaxID=2796471 RepID=A0A934UTJ3_9MICO|nr:LLM class flavin-dependent oxidoreductase [Leucobacter chromiisoli]MBK0417770.1 LLM class flavin-dependent oxidoreductase [Leucobacter chromiisoli]